MSNIRRGGVRRRTTLPRARPSPEHNIIQKPEILRRLTQQLGIRQAHVVPALNDGVQAVVLLDDLTARISPNTRALIGVTDPGATSQVGPPATFAFTALVNPNLGFNIASSPLPQSTVNARVRRVMFSHQNGAGNNARVHLVAYNHAQSAKLNNPGQAGIQGFVEPFAGNSVQSPINNCFVVKYDGQIQGADLQVVSLSIVSTIQDTPWQWDFNDRPLVLSPGKALGVFSEESTVGTNTQELWATFEWEEEPLGVR